METAKLVAQVANIASEDWARLYEFHHVMWPPTPTQTPVKIQTNTPPAQAQAQVQATNTTPRAEDLSSSYNTMDSLSRAAVQDLLAEHKSSLLISVGHESSCFGTMSPNTSTPSKSNRSSNVSTSIGVWPKIINQCAAMLDTKGIGEYLAMLQCKTIA